MAPQESEKWLTIRREHFPDTSVRADVGAKWYPAKSPPPRAARYRPHGLLPGGPSSGQNGTRTRPMGKHPEGETKVQFLRLAGQEDLSAWVTLANVKCSQLSPCFLCSRGIVNPSPQLLQQQGPKPSCSALAPPPQILTVR